MLSLFANSFWGALQLAGLLLFSKAGMATALMLWQHVGCCNGLLRFCRNARTVPFLMLELRFRLNLRYWGVRLSRLMFHCDGCPFFPFVFSGKFLLRRDGHNIFDFFKTLSLNDVSPPARA